MNKTLKKSITQNDIAISTNDGECRVKIYGKINENNVRQTIRKFVKSDISGNDTVSKIERDIVKGNFLIIDRNEITATYECDYEEFLKIAHPVMK